MSDHPKCQAKVVAYKSLDNIESKFFIITNLEHGNCRVLPHAPMPMQSFIHEKVNFKKKNLVLPTEKFPFLVLARNMINVSTPYYVFQSSIFQVVTYRRLKISNFQLEKWLLTLTRGCHLQRFQIQ